MARKDEDNSGRSPPSDLPKREKLSPALQKILDNTESEDNFYDELFDGT